MKSLFFRQNPTPMDKFIEPILRSYKNLENSPKTFHPRLMMDESRIKTVMTKDGPTLIMSAKVIPFGGLMDDLKIYHTFFNLYQFLIMMILDAMDSYYHRPYAIRKTHKTLTTLRARVWINLLKVVVAAMRNNDLTLDEWEELNSQLRVFNVFSTSETPQEILIKNLGLAKYVGGRFETGDALMSEVFDEKLIDSFWKYTQNIGKTKSYIFTDHHPSGTKFFIF